MANEQTVAGTPVLTNELDFQPDYESLGRDFDFFKLTTSEKYIQRGARCLDDPQNELKAVSFSFDYGRTAFFMFRKDQKVDESQISMVIHRDKTGDALTVERVVAEDIKAYIMLRLLINAISNFSGDYVFNNLSGKIYMVYEVTKSEDNLKALEIGTDWMGHLNAIATTFTRVSVFGKAADWYLNDEPAYVREGNKRTLKRSWNFANKDVLYIRKFVPGKKTRMPFYKLDDDKKEDCKAYYLYQVLKLINTKFGSYLKRPLSFKEMIISKGIETSHDRRFMDKVHSHFYGLKAQKINCVNLLPAGEADSVFDRFVALLKQHFEVDANGEVGPEVVVSGKIDYSAANIVLAHDEDYYKSEEHGGVLNDPYKTLPRMDAVIQSITLEEAGDFFREDITKEKKPKKYSELQALLKTILKELVVKDDIVHAKEITIDDWKDYKFPSDWIFGLEDDGVQYYMTIHPNGGFEMKYATAGFVSSLPEQFQPLAKALATSKEKTKTVVADCSGNVNLISKTGMFVMPKEESFGMQKIRENEREYMNGVFDINYYEKWNKGLYSVGVPHAALQYGLSNATLIYQADPIQGKNIIVNVLETFSVWFVKLDSFTVLPYPFKYLREYALMDIYATGRWKEKLAAKKNG
jgi:hypothetical protein